MLSNRPENLREYYRVLTDFAFLSEKLEHPEFGIQALIEDYDLIDDEAVADNPEFNVDKVKALK